MQLVQSNNFAWHKIPYTCLRYYLNDIRFFKGSLNPVAHLEGSDPLVFTLRDLSDTIYYSKPLNSKEPLQSQLFKILLEASDVELDLCHAKYQSLPRDLGDFTEFDVQERVNAFVISDNHYYEGYTHASILEDHFGISNTDDVRPDLPLDIPIALGEIIEIDNDTLAAIVEGYSISNMTMSEIISILRSYYRDIQIYKLDPITGWLQDC